MEMPFLCKIEGSLNKSTDNKSNPVISTVIFYHDTEDNIPRLQVYIHGNLTYLAQLWVCSEFLSHVAVSVL